MTTIVVLFRNQKKGKIITINRGKTSNKTSPYFAPAETGNKSALPRLQSGRELTGNARLSGKSLEMAARHAIIYAPLHSRGRP